MNVIFFFYSQLIFQLIQNTNSYQLWQSKYLPNTDVTVFSAAQNVREKLLDAVHAVVAS